MHIRSSLLSYDVYLLSGYDPLNDLLLNSIVHERDLNAANIIVTLSEIIYSRCILGEQDRSEFVLAGCYKTTQILINLCAAE